MTKKVTGNTNVMSFTVNPNDSQMEHANSANCGSDGDIKDLKFAVKNMIEKLNLLLEEEEEKEEVTEEVTEEGKVTEEDEVTEKEESSEEEEGESDRNKLFSVVLYIYVAHI